jgi:hypothetical protein
MSTLYYTAKRNSPLTKEEIQLIDDLVKKYSDDEILELTHEGGGETFSFYPQEKSSEIILEGSTKLPVGFVPHRSEDVFLVADNWLSLLAHIRDLIPVDEWDVRLENDKFLWNPDTKEYDFPKRR